MKKVLGLAAAGLLAYGVANAGTLTVANSDITLYGGVSTGWEYYSNDLLDTQTGPQPNDNFRLYTFAVGLMKKPTSNSPIGFNAAFAKFEVPTVLASTEVVNNENNVLGLGSNKGLVQLGKTNDGFKPWLAEVQIQPIDGFTIAGGILWSKYGEKPLTILNPHINRGLMYVFFNPVAYTGIRADYAMKLPGLGDVDVYAGYNNANGLRNVPAILGGYNTGNSEDAYELGIAGTLKFGATFKYGLHYYDESQGRNIWTLCLKSDFGIVKGGLQYSLAKKDDKIKRNGISNSYWGIGVNFNVSLLDAAIANVEFPMRLEYVKRDVDADNDGSKDKIWSFTITPTWKPTKNTFLRAEYTYTKSDANTFVDIDDGTTDDKRSTFSVEAGFLF